MIATLADIVPNFSFWGGFILFYFGLLLFTKSQMENFMFVLRWQLLPLKIHTEICSPFELGQCLLALFFFFFNSLLPPPSPVACPILRANAVHSYRSCVNSRPFNRAHSSSSARVDVLCKISCAVSFCLSMPPLYSDHGLLVGM